MKSRGGVNVKRMKIQGLIFVKRGNPGCQALVMFILVPILNAKLFTCHLTCVEQTSMLLFLSASFYGL